MHIKTLVIPFILLLSACRGKQEEQEGGIALVGTWKLISGTVIAGRDTTTTWYTRDQSFLKIINRSHFAFLQHPAKGAAGSFSAGGGRYTLKGNRYTEHLEYCSDRRWEGNDFSFTVSLQQDTLIQTGIEKVAGAGINRLNIEKYTRVK